MSSIIKEMFPTCWLCGKPRGECKHTSLQESAEDVRLAQRGLVPVKLNGKIVGTATTEDGQAIITITDLATIAHFYNAVESDFFAKRAPLELVADISSCLPGAGDLDC
jgi:hypothetical protein